MMAEKSVAQIISENLESLRKSRRLTRKELAVRTGFSETALASYEKGERLPPIDKILKMAQVLECSITDLVGDNEDFSPERELLEQRILHCVDIAEYAGYSVYWDKSAKKVFVSMAMWLEEDEKGNEKFPKRPVIPVFQNELDFVIFFEDIEHSFLNLHRDDLYEEIVSEIERRERSKKLF